MVPWTTATLPVDPTRTSPAGNVDIRILPNFASGEITHARVESRSTSTAAFIENTTEFFYVLEGEGQLWRRLGKEEEVVSLKPGRCVSIPPGVHYQFRCVSPPLNLLVIVAPRWHPDHWHEASEPYWGSEGTELRRRPLVGPITSWQRQDFPAQPDYPAPDGSQIRLLLECPEGGICHCTLPPGATSSPVRHGNVEEVWYVLRGEGEIWRALNGDEEVATIRKDMCVTLPAAVSFQFRTVGSSPLEMLIGTFPRWPGPQEAIPVTGHWGVAKLQHT
jgi:mannose-6-phosphate isomerase-like protein (cupin superfamily)